MVIFGEIGLSGEVRAVAQTDLRLKEAAKLGFTQALVPAGPRRSSGGSGGQIPALRRAGHVQDVLALVGPGS
jgi:DNA repair protein RadA/Sms